MRTRAQGITRTCTHCYCPAAACNASHTYAYTTAHALSARSDTQCAHTMFTHTPFNHPAYVCALFVASGSTRRTRSHSSLTLTQQAARSRYVHSGCSTRAHTWHCITHEHIHAHAHTDIVLQQRASDASHMHTRRRTQRHPAHTHDVHSTPFNHPEYVCALYCC